MPVTATNGEKVNAVINARVAHGLLRVNEAMDTVSLPVLKLEPTLGEIHDTMKALSNRLASLKIVLLGLPPDWRYVRFKCSVIN